MATYCNPTPIVLQPAAAATGNGTAIDLALPNDGFETVGVQLSGTFSATVTFEATIDGTNWIAILLTNLNAGTTATTATAAGLFRFDAKGLFQFRARVSAYTSGNVTVTALAIG